MVHLATRLTSGKEQWIDHGLQFSAATLYHFCYALLQTDENASTFSQTLAAMPKQVFSTLQKPRRPSRQPQPAERYDRDTVAPVEPITTQANLSASQPLNGWGMILSRGGLEGSKLCVVCQQL